MSKGFWLFSLFALGTINGVAHAELSPVHRAKIAPSLQRALTLESSRVDILVYLTKQADLRSATILESHTARAQHIYDALRHTARSTQPAVLEELATENLSNSSRPAYRRFHIANVIAIEDASPELVERLAGRSDVAKVYADKAFKAIPLKGISQVSFDDNAAGTLGVGENIRHTGADRVWNEFGAKGQGIVVAGADTGIEWTHPGLKHQYRGWMGSEAAASHAYNWHDAIKSSLIETANPCGYDTEAPCDDDAHGTHTLGTIVGDDGLGNQVGMAPEAQWIGCRNMDQGYGKPSTYLSCFEFFLAPYPHGGDPMRDGDPSKAPHVINNSWGCPTDEGCEGDEFVEALAALADAGIMVVAAAGNAGSRCGTINDAPAHHSDAVLVVGAIDHRTDSIASFSSRGPSQHDNKIGPDLSAPGVNVRSTIPGGGYSGSMWSGTSMASPHVAGAVALLWSKEPSLIGQIQETTHRLTSKAEAKTSSQTCSGVDGLQIPNNTYGYGIMNVYESAK